MPIPIEGEELMIEKSYPFAAVFAKQEEAEPNGVKLRNQFYSRKVRCDIFIYEEDGRIKWGFSPAVHHFTFDLQTLGCSFAWGIEQESRAVHLLGTLVRHHQFKTYMLTGMFLESSERSGLTYCFRRLKPTVALTTKRRTEEISVLTSLCMHPIGYYRGSWAGAMCPTDDVIAHLMLMRADEPMFWKRCQQHPPHRPEAGL